MRHLKFITLIIVYFLFNINVSASNCSSKEQIILNEDTNDIKIIYEIVNQNKIDITIYNLTENIFLDYIEPTTKETIIVNYNDTKNNKYTITRNSDEIEKFTFTIRSNLSNCYTNILKTINIIKPKYNKFSKLEICNNNELKNHTYCQEYTEQDITKSESEVINTLEEYLSVRVGKITTKASVDSGIDIQKIIIYSSLIAIIVGIIIALLVIKKKRSEL